MSPPRTAAVAAPAAQVGAYGLMPMYGGGMNSEYARIENRPAPRYASAASASICCQGVIISC